MAFVKADRNKEIEELNKLVSENDDAKQTYEAFIAKIAIQQQLINMRKAEHMTQIDVANATGMSQQAVSRIEKGSGVTLNSLLRYLIGIGYCIELRKKI